MPQGSSRMDRQVKGHSPGLRTDCDSAHAFVIERLSWTAGIQKGKFAVTANRFAGGKTSTSSTFGKKYRVTRASSVNTSPATCTSASLSCGICASRLCRRTRISIAVMSWSGL